MLTSMNARYATSTGRPNEFVTTLTALTTAFVTIWHPPGTQLAADGHASDRIQSDPIRQIRRSEITNDFYV